MARTSHRNACGHCFRQRHAPAFPVARAQKQIGRVIDSVQRVFARRRVIVHEITVTVENVHAVLKIELRRHFAQICAFLRIDARGMQVKLCRKFRAHRLDVAQDEERLRQTLPFLVLAHVQDQEIGRLHPILEKSLPYLEFLRLERPVNFGVNAVGQYQHTLRSLLPHDIDGFRVLRFRHPVFPLFE